MEAYAKTKEIYIYLYVYINIYFDGSGNPPYSAAVFSRRCGAATSLITMLFFDIYVILALFNEYLVNSTILRFSLIPVVR